MKWIERMVMILAVVALVFCWVGLPGCTAIFALQLNKHDKGQSRYTVPPGRVAPDGQVRQKNQMKISSSWAPQLGLEVSGSKPSLGVGAPAPVTADVKKDGGDKDKPTTRPAAEAAKGEPGNVN